MKLRFQIFVWLLSFYEFASYSSSTSASGACRKRSIKSAAGNLCHDCGPQQKLLIKAVAAATSHDCEHSVPVVLADMDLPRLRHSLQPPVGSCSHRNATLLGHHGPCTLEMNLGLRSCLCFVCWIRQKLIYINCISKYFQTSFSFPPVFRIMLLYFVLFLIIP